MKKFIVIFLLFSLLFLIQFSLMGQKNSRSYSLNQVEVSLYNGGAINQVKPLVGVDKPQNSIGLDHSLNVNYNRLLTNDLSLTLGWGFGFQAFTFKLAEKSGFYGTVNFPYWQNAVYNIYHKLFLKGIYNLQVNKDNRLRFSLGGGILQFLPSGSGICSSNAEEITEYDLHITYPNQTTPFAVIGLDYIFPLKNKNELSVGLQYNHSFTKTYEGKYQLYDNTSNGELFSSGTTVGLNVSYIFTGNLTQQKIKARNKNLSDEKAARKEVRKEQRYLDPKATFVNIYGGIGSGITKVNDPGAYLMNSGVPDLFAGIEYEHGINNNFFISGGYHFLQHYHSVGLISLGMSSGSSAFYAHNFTIGGGFRIITPENFKLLNVYGGFAAGFISSPIGSGSSGGISVSQMGGCSECFIQVSSTGETISKLILGAYLGASKDFRLTDFFYLSINYRYLHGFNPVFESDIVYESSYFDGTKTATAKIDGTAHMFSLGIKLRFR